MVGSSSAGAPEAEDAKSLVRTSGLECRPVLRRKARHWRRVDGVQARSSWRRQCCSALLPPHRTVGCARLARWRINGGAEVTEVAAFGRAQATRGTTFLIGPTAQLIHWTILRCTTVQLLSKSYRIF